MTTASALATACGNRFRDSTNVVVSPQQWLAYLNEALNEINTSSQFWPWLETSEQTVNLTAGTRSASLPTDVWTVNWVYDTTDDYRLIPQEGRGDQWHQDRLRSETGQPVTYRLRGSTIEVFPNPTANTTLVLEGVKPPDALAATTNAVTSATGGSAGALTATGVASGDTLISVIGVKDSDQSVHDYTSEFAITGTDTIDNTGGSATTGYHLTVTYSSLSGSASPPFGQEWDYVIIAGALARAYDDDGNQPWADRQAAKFQAGIKAMQAFYFMARTETNTPIRDTFWS